MSKKVAVIGLGKSGSSAASYLQSLGFTVFVTDDKQTVGPEGSIFLPAERLAAQLVGIDFVVISPGVPLTHVVAVQAKALGLEVFCDVELAFRRLSQKPTAVVGITGSNGKTTTTSLTCHILNSSGINAKAVGNIGNPILSEVAEPKDALVAELSSFQLETMSTKVLDAACILNITPNHLDRHGTMEEYVKAKRRIGECVKPDGAFWVQKAASWSPDLLHFGFDEACELYTDGKSVYRFGVKESELPETLQNSRSHNVENYLAAYALARALGAPCDMPSIAYSSFVKPKHRLEYVCSHNGISFYDDSKATSVDAVLRAVESLPCPIVLIAGGVHKGYPYTAWQKAFAGKVRACVLIGQAADIIEQDLERAVPIFRANSLEEAVSKAIGEAKSQDAVLLSPGCASYDMFTSFEDRGSKFQQIVRALCKT